MSDIKTNSAAIVPDRSKIDLEDHRISYKLIEQYYPEVSDNALMGIQRNIFRHLSSLRQAFPDFSQLAGLRIIDLACGSRSWGGNFQHRYDPWMSRLLLELGAKPLGLDLCEQQKENFESRVVDLTKLGALNFLESKSFDSFYISAFPTDTFLSVIAGREIGWNQIKHCILCDLTRSLKEGSKIIRGFTESNEDFVRNVITEQFSQVNDDEL